MNDVIKNDDLEFASFHIGVRLKFFFLINK